MELFERLLNAAQSGQIAAPLFIVLASHPAPCQVLAPAPFALAPFARVSFALRRAAAARR